MSKQPTCKHCGSHSHWSYMCFQNPKRKSAIKRKYSQYKAGKVPKRDKLLSDEKSLDRKRLILELDRYCSLCVRLGASNRYGVVSCYTCGKKIPWRQAHCCHFISRRFGGTRFDFQNLRAGCENCNVALHGNLEVYRQRLAREIGEKAIAELEMKKNNKISTPELKEMLEIVKQKYKNIVEEKKANQIK